MRCHGGCPTWGTVPSTTYTRSKGEHQQDEWLAEFFMADPYWEFQGGRLRLTAGETVIELEAVD